MVENALAALVMGECFRSGPQTAPGCYRIAVLDRPSEPRPRSI
jgi:hypothetical protein